MDMEECNCTSTCSRPSGHPSKGTGLSVPWRLGRSRGQPIASPQWAQLQLGEVLQATPKSNEGFLTGSALMAEEAQHRWPQEARGTEELSVNNLHYTGEPTQARRA